MPPIVERRRARRLPVAIPVSLTDGAGGPPAFGVVRDVSEVGMLIEMAEALIQPCGERVVEVAFRSGARTVRAAEVRREAGADGQLLVALETLGLAEGASRGVAGTPPEPPPRRGSVVAPRCVVRGELRALGAAALDHAILAPGGGVPEGLRQWLTSLADELGTTREPPETAAELVEAVRLLWDAA